MRPQRLVVRGFAAFRDEVELDFGDADFFALVGPTGAGKSSVIDAICFALYGSVPRYEDERVVTPVITTDAVEARVQLDFVSNGAPYRIMRIVRRKGAPKVQLDRLSDDGTLGDTLTSAVREAKQLVTDLVGLSFDQFTKCVVLPQGAFARLLHAGEAERNKLLTSLLDLGVYDRIAALAGERQAKIESEIATDDRVLQELGVVDDATLAAAAQRLGALQALYKEIDGARAEAATLAERLALARTEVAAVERAIAALDAVEVAPEVGEVAVEREALVTRLRTAEAAHATARAAAESAAEIAGRGLGLDALRTIVQAHRRLATLDETRTQAVADHNTHLATLERTNAAHAEAEHALAAARESLDARRAEHAAHALATRLAVGEPCPVCEQVVTTLDQSSRRTAPRALEHAEQEVARAEKSVDGARRSVAEAERAVTRAATQVEALDAQRAELATITAPIPGFDAAEEALAAAEVAAGALEDARKQASVALDEETAARRALERFDQRVDAIASAFHSQRDAIAVAGVTGAPAPTGQLAPDWTALHAWAAEAASAQRIHIAESKATCDELVATADALVDRFVEPASALGVAVDRAPSIDRLRDAVREAGIDARHRHDRLVEARESAARITGRAEGLREQLAVARELRQHLRTTNFKTWLLGRAVDSLAARATERLLELSGGRYELMLGENDDFEVVDRRNAGEHRPVRSLSGGETFEASLALALALAEQVAVLSAAGARSLESIFLDEGFGTLDPEALDLVAGAVETLGGEGRMVGIVTHVGALAERVPVRFRVANDGRTATVTREG